MGIFSKPELGPVPCWEDYPAVVACLDQIAAFDRDKNELELELAYGKAPARPAAQLQGLLSSLLRRRNFACDMLKAEKQIVSRDLENRRMQWATDGLKNGLLTTKGQMAARLSNAIVDAKKDGGRGEHDVRVTSNVPVVSDALIDWEQIDRAANHLIIPQPR